QAASEVFRLRHAPRVSSWKKRRHHRWVECRGMVWTDDHRPVSWHILHAYDTEEADEKRPGHRAHQPAHECVCQPSRRPCSTWLTMRSTTWSRSRLSVSMTTASGAGRKGAMVRSVSTRSLASTSRRIASEIGRASCRERVQYWVQDRS